ncbi:hypothetical protein TRIP_C90278 [Candidatus Zixiibacteriota bacterium]|nr:hypothetical protein TRIP_C90278 [candidate division Zixibacteria bacterium]
MPKYFAVIEDRVEKRRYTKQEQHGAPDKHIASEFLMRYLVIPFRNLL